MRPETRPAARPAIDRFDRVGAGRRWITCHGAHGLGEAGGTQGRLLGPPRIVALVLASLLGLGFLIVLGDPLPEMPARPAPSAARLIPEEDMLRVSESGRLAGIANACGLDWTPYYLSFMRAERSKQWNGFQFSMISGLFGYHQERAAASFGTCTAHRRRVIELEIGRRMSDYRL